MRCQSTCTLCQRVRTDGCSLLSHVLCGLHCTLWRLLKSRLPLSPPPLPAAHLPRTAATLFSPGGVRSLRENPTRLDASPGRRPLHRDAQGAASALLHTASWAVETCLASRAVYASEDPQSSGLVHPVSPRARPSRAEEMHQTRGHGRKRFRFGREENADSHREGERGRKSRDATAQGERTMEVTRLEPDLHAERRNMPPDPTRLTLN